jgi:glucan-binding YG repeat protein
MAIEKKIDIIVDVSDAVTDVNKLDNSMKALDKTTQSLGSTQTQTKQAVLDNGGAMGLLNDATGGLAMTFKDAVEASSLFGKQSKIGIATQKAYTFVMGTSTGAMKAFKLALIGTGIGVLVVLVAKLIANFDNVKKAVMSFIPALEIVGDFIGKIVDAVTDFVGITSDATRALDEFERKSKDALDKSTMYTELNAYKHDEYTNRKYKANQDYYKKSLELVEMFRNGEIKSQEELDAFLKQAREKANYEIDQADADRQAKQKEAQNKQIESERAEYKRKQDELKARRVQELKEIEEFEAEIRRLKYGIEKKEDDRQKQISADSSQRLQDNATNAQNLLIATANVQANLDEDLQRKEEILMGARVQMAQQTFALIGEIAGEGSKVAKALAVGQATISAYEAVMNAFKSAQGSPITSFFPAYPFVQAGIAGAFGALQIKKILATDPSKGGGNVSSGGSGGGQAPSAPSFNLVGGTGINQIAQGLGQQQQPIQAYVVSGNVTSAQALDRNIVNTASVG